jgi:murein DD-endopeptidase MepM/ murein hydrolase activator NlpD
MVVSKNGYLSLAEMTENAEYILGYLLSKGWTRNAICGLLGNMQTESTINPGIWQSLNSYDSTPYVTVNGQGYGLVQWTPFNKYTVWARDNGYDYADIDAQLERIIYETVNNLQWFGGYSDTMTFQQFTQSTETPEYLAEVFIKTYEHPGDPDQPIRGTQARYWWDNLSGTGTIEPGSGNENDICFIFPTETHNVTSGFEPPDRPDHYGVDFADGVVHDIVASAAGTVTRSDVSDSYGEVVYILHTINGQEYETVYAHMSTGSRTVSLGDTVTQGQKLGVMGSTGDSTGLHLHFELYKGRWTADHINAIDPMTLLGKGGCGNPTQPGNPQTTINHKIISMLLSDTLNGWKW